MPERELSSGTLDFSDREVRIALAKMVTKMFELWKLGANDMLDLLGMRPSSRSVLARYRKGHPLPDRRDMADRVGYLLSMHKALGLLYPYNENIRSSWVLRRNKLFNNLTPLEVMKEQGMVGLARVAACLEFQLGDKGLTLTPSPSAKDCRQFASESIGLKSIDPGSRQA